MTLLEVRPLLLAEGRLALDGLLLTVGRLALTRLELLPERTEVPADCGRLDMLPPLVRLLRPSLVKARLMEPPVELPCLTLAT